MKITLSKNAGFCPGVRRADEGVMKLVGSSDKDSLVFTLGPLIHNGEYVKELEKKGVYSIAISDVERIISENSRKKITFVIRAHGIPREDEEYLQSLCRA